MRTSRCLAIAAIAATSVLVSDALEAKEVTRYPIVIGHRGASGYRPEHTLAAYELAIDLGADWIEPDLVSTRDGVLVARHDNVLNLTTDVAAHPEFAGRKTTKTLDGVVVPDSWFSEDFTLAEIKTLRAIERIPSLRPANAAYDGQFEVPTLQEVIDLVRRKGRETGRRIGIYPETKHPTYFDAVGLSLEEPLVEVLSANGYRSANDPVFIQSFEIANLKDLATRTRLPLVQLLNSSGKPFDVQAAGGTLTYADMATPAGLAEIATYAGGVGPEKYTYIIPKDGTGNLDVAATKPFVGHAHAVGLLVHPWTFRAENFFLPTDFKSDTPADPTDLGDSAGEIAAFLATGIDGFFTDQPDIGVAARDAFAAAQSGRSRGNPPAGWLRRGSK